MGIRIGEYEIGLSPLGWLAFAAAAAAGAFAPGKGFRRQYETRREGNRTMAYKLTVYIVNPDDEQIYVEHNFYGYTRDEAEQIKREHIGTCEYFKAAVAEGRTIEEGEEIEADEWPSVDEGEDAEDGG
jgi:hypothetical protein